jgi:hypothetical protein
MISKVIVGSTGPVLIMTGVIYDMAKNIGVPFLTFYAWVSVWTFVYTTVTAFFDWTRFVKLATRFTDDIFALLIVSIFILNAIGSPFGSGGLLRYMDPNHKIHVDYEKELEAGNIEDYNYLKTAILSILIGLATTATIFALRGLKESPYLCNQLSRNSLHDFAVTIAVILWAVLTHVAFPTVELEELNVPDAFEPTFNCCNAECTLSWPDECPDLTSPIGTRSWFADMSDLNGKQYAIGVAAGPALLAFILLYLDNGITWHLIYSPRNKLQHGDSYNWDLFLNGLCNLINGLLGLPWLVATTVPCIVHVNNLTEKDQDGNIVSVQENRLTYLISHLLVGLSLLFLPAMKMIPMPVLLGVFLFMGLSSIGRIDFWNRFLMFFQQPSLYKKEAFTKYMKISRYHMFTIIQLCFFAGVFMVQNTKSIAIAFPFMTLMCIPGRLYLLPKIFENWELLLLDGEEEEIEHWIQQKENIGETVHIEPDDGSGDEQDAEINSSKRFPIRLLEDEE